MKKLLLYFVFTFMFIYLNAQQTEFSSTNSLEPENFSINQLSSIATWEASGDTTVQPILFKLFLGDTLYAEVPGDEFSYHFSCLTYGLDYTASIHAVYDWTDSDTVSTNWTSTYLPTVHTPFFLGSTKNTNMQFVIYAIPDCNTNIYYPSFLIGFNIYKDGIHVAWLPYDPWGTIYFVNNDPPGTYVYCASAIYELGVFGFPGSTGESDLACDTLQITWVGVDEHTLSDNVKIYPNPSTDQITISSSVKISEITVFDQIGNQLLVIDGLQSQKEIIDISIFYPGVYTLKLKTENGIVNKRVVKM